MTINTGMMGITGGVSHADFVRNAQHVGMQKTNGIKSENEETQQASSDSVSISFSSQAEESKESKDTKESGKANSSSQTETTQGSDKTQNAGQTQSSKENSSGTVTVDLSSSSAPTAGELDFNEGAIGSNLLSSETSSETSTALVPADGGSGNGGSGSTALIPVGGGPGTDLVPVNNGPGTAIVPVGDSCTDVIPVVDAEIVDDGETSEAGNANASTETQQTQQEDPLEYLKKLKEMEEQQQQAEAIWMEIMAAREKHFAQMMKLILDTQNAIYDMIESTLQAQAATQDKVFMGWDAAINGK